jgi:hypothetical protein
MHQIKNLTEFEFEQLAKEVVQGNLIFLHSHFPNITTKAACDILGIDQSGLYQDINLAGLIREYKINSVLKKDN